MDKYILLKQAFYNNYDMIRFDTITLTKSIQNISELQNDDINEVCKIINNLYNEIFQSNIKEMLLIMNIFLKNDDNYSVEKLLNGLEVIKKSVIKKERIYCKYVDKIYNL